jgi:TPP-dependent indolepyruvate ferredoxin oxidoreductase alpha subunit
VTWIDPIDMRVRQILASAFARAHRPKLTVDPEECANCHGDGTVEVACYSINPSSGVLGRDPQATHTERCDVCRGTGLADVANG